METNKPSIKPTIKPMEKREFFSPSSFSIREGEDQGKTIEGVAVVTERETVLYEGPDFREIEVIAQSCIDPAFMAEQDMKLNLLHRRDESFARTPKSLHHESRADGLHFTAEVPDCDLGKRAVALIDNGTYTGCSFEFYPKDYQVSERKASDGKTEYVIRHTAFEKVTALTIAMDPAYSATSVGVRELYRELHPAEDDTEGDKLREQQEREAAEAAAKEAEEAARIEREYNYRKRQLQMKSL
jgi:phage head maturation protease